MSTDDPTAVAARYFEVWRAGDLDGYEALLADDVANTHEIDVLGGDLDGQVALGDLELEVDLVLAADGPGLDLFDQRCTVVRVDDSLPNRESHLQVSPFAGGPS